MQYFDCISASGSLRIVFPQGGNVNLYMPLKASKLAGTVNRDKYKIAACGDAIFHCISAGGTVGSHGSGSYSRKGYASSLAGTVNRDDYKTPLAIFLIAFTQAES